MVFAALAFPLDAKKAEAWGDWPWRSRVIVDDSLPREVMPRTIQTIKTETKLTVLTIGSGFECDVSFYLRS